jgi:hypothetical protein
MLRKLARSISLALAICSLAAASAYADYCITKGGGVVGGVSVGKGFKIPKAGECTEWRGLCTSGCSPDNVQDGVACTASDGSHVSFGITTYYLASNRQFDWIRLNLPGASGSGNLNYQLPALGTQNYTATGAACGAQPVR